ncbi:MAG: SGNH/GDSL hydrolase family protein [Arenibacterium sp.]
MTGKFATLFAVLMALSACGETVTRGENARILAMGDSLLASNMLSEASVSHRLEVLLGEPVVDRSVVGASMLHALPLTGMMGLNISQQYYSGNWDWIIVNGGGNDLWLGCGCQRCESKMDRLIAADSGDGEIPELVANLRNTGARIIYVGYLRSPGRGSPIEHCRDEGDELETRIARLAKDKEGVYFLSLRDLVPFGDRSFHAADMIHPSRKASDRIAQKIYQIIQKGGG